MSAEIQPAVSAGVRPAQVLRTPSDEQLEAKLKISLIERGYKNVGPTLIYRLALRLLPDYFTEHDLSPRGKDSVGQ